MMLFAIFLNNKLITCDTSVPFVMEVAQANPSIKVEFYVGDLKTFQMIRANLVLWDAIHHIGKIMYYGRTDDDRAGGILGLIAHRLRVLHLLTRLSFLGLMGKAVFMHFRALNYWPLKLLYVLSPMNTYASQGMVTGYSEVERQVDNSGRQRVNFMSEPAAKGGLIAYSTEWAALSNNNLDGVPQYILGKFWYGRAWPKFIEANAELYLSKELQKAGYAADSKIIVYILGFLGAVESTPEADTFKKLLLKSLEILHAENHDLPVFLKPHFNTNVQEVQDILDEYPDNKFVITHLHPAVLSKRARFLMANYYSTTMAVSHACGVPNVEFSRYSEVALKAANGQSMRPDLVDYYINDDPEKFRETIRSILASPIKEPKMIGSDDPTGVILKIAGKVA